MSAQPKEVKAELVISALKLPAKENKLLAELKKSGKRLDVIEKDWDELPDLTTTAGMKLARSRRAELVGMRTGGDSTRKLITKPARDLVDSINKLWKSYIPRIESVEKVYDDAIKAVEEAKEAAKAEKLALDANRKAAIVERLDVINGSVARGVTIANIDLELEILNDADNDLFADFEEYSDTAHIQIESAKTALTERRVQLVAQADEAKKLEEQRAEQAEEQGRIDAQKEEQRKEDEARAKEQADFEKEKAEFAAAKSAEKNRKDQAERDRQARIDRVIHSINTSVDQLSSIVDCTRFGVMLDAHRASSKGGDFEERASEVDDAIQYATDALAIKRDEFEAVEKLADEKAAQELEDARLLGIQQQKEREEQERKDAEARQAEAAAEAQRIAAMQPELERVRTWLETLHVAKLPVIESAQLAEVTKVYDNAICKMDEMLTVLEMQKAA